MEKSSSKHAYSIVNFSLLIIFFVTGLYLIFTNEPMRCYYVKNYGHLCSTCGITRDFKSILTIQFSGLINPKSLYYFGAFVLLFLSRIGVLMLLSKSSKLKNIIKLDITLGFSLLVFILWLQLI